MKSENELYKQQNIMLNFLKGCACISVVFIHIKFPGLFGQTVHKLSGYAVPVFFMIAGYYAYDIDASVIKRRLNKILKIFILGYSCFFVWNVFLKITTGGELINWLINLITLKKAIYFFIFCTIGYAIPLWYLIAMAETYMLWYFVIKKNSEDYMVRIAPLLFLLQIFLTSYCETMDMSWSYKINFLTRSLTWFLLGYYFHTENGKRYKNISTAKLLLGVIIVCIITIIPTLFDIALKFSCIGYIPYAGCLFLIALKYPEKSISKPIEYIGDKLSLNIYIFHVIIASIIAICLRNILNVDISNNLIYLWSRPIITVIVTIVFSHMLTTIGFKTKHLLTDFYTRRIRQ